MLTLVLIIALGILFMVLSISRWDWHPVFSLLVTSVGLGFAFGLDGSTIVRTMSSGFGNILGYIGLIVVFGSIIGVALERSGAALRIAEFILDLIGPKHPALAVAVIGALTSIPVFCDSGFILLSGLNKSLAKRSGEPLGVLALSLAAGLYTTHTLVPPTPGPIAAAGQLGAENYLGTIMLLGLLVSVPVVLVAHGLSKWLGRSLVLEPLGSEAEDFNVAKVEQGSHVDRVPPSLIVSFLPLVLPILLIAAATVVQFMNWKGLVAEVLLFIGQPLVALLLACIPAWLLARPQTKEWIQWSSAGVELSGPILIITGAGGAFGAILKASPLQTELDVLLAGSVLSYTALLLLAFTIAALLKTAQGSSTTALVVTAGMLSPLVAALGLTESSEFALIVLSIGAGAMTVSHANDSYFWVVTRFSGIPVGQAYRSYTLMTGLMGLVSMGMILLLRLVSLALF